MQKNQKRRNKKIILLGLLLLISSLFILGNVSEAKSISITKKTFPDKYVRKKIRKYDKNKNGKLEEKEKQKIKKLILYKEKGNLNIKGLSKCTYLKELKVDIPGKMWSAKEIGKLKKLRIYSVTNANKKIDVSSNKNLLKLELNNLKLKKVNFRGNKKLNKLHINDCKKITEIKLSKNTNLKELKIYGNVRTKKLLIKESPKLETIKICANDKLKTFEMHNTPCVKIIEIYDNLKTVVMDRAINLVINGCEWGVFALNKMPNLEVLEFNGKGFNPKELLNVPHLIELRVNDSEIVQLDLSMLTQLESLTWRKGKLESLKVNNDVIKKLRLDNNNLSGTWNLNQFPNLYHFECNNNKIEKIIATNHKNINLISCENNNIQEMNAFGADYFYYFFGKGNPNAKLYFYYPKEDSHTNYSFDRTATTYYDTNG